MSDDSPASGTSERVLTPVPCFVCERPLREVMNKEGANQPSFGLHFVTHGHYGGTVFDPMDGHFLNVNICDACLVERKDRVVIGRDREPIIENEMFKGDDLNALERVYDEAEATYVIPTLVGWRDVDEPLVPWQPELEHDDAYWSKEKEGWVQHERH